MATSRAIARRSAAATGARQTGRPTAMRQIADVGRQPEEEDEHDPRRRPRHPVLPLPTIAEPGKHGSDGDDHEYWRPNFGPKAHEACQITPCLGYRPGFQRYDSGNRSPHHRHRDNCRYKRRLLDVGVHVPLQVNFLPPDDAGRIQPE